MIQHTAELKKGDIVLWWSDVFLAHVQKAFTKRGARGYDPQPRTGEKSHTSLVYSVSDYTAEHIDVAWKIKLNKMQIETVSAKWIYRLIDVPKHEIDHATDYIWQKYKGKQYPWWQWQTYPSRWWYEIMDKHRYWTLPFQPLRWLQYVGHKHKDARAWGTIFPSGAVCSEATFWDFLLTGICTIRIKNKDVRFIRLAERLNQWSANKFHSTDAEVVCDDFKDNIFELIYHKPLTTYNLPLN